VAEWAVPAAVLEEVQGEGALAVVDVDSAIKQKARSLGPYFCAARSTLGRTA